MIVSDGCCDHFADFVVMDFEDVSSGPGAEILRVTDGSPSSLSSI
jgi:hypothetical protein